MQRLNFKWAVLFLVFYGSQAANAQPQQLNHFKPDRQLEKTVDNSLRLACDQYRLMMPQLPEGALPGGYDAKNARLWTIKPSAWTSGFYPGVLLYMTWWFPSYYRSRMMGLFQSASVISLFIGPPLGGLLLQLHGRAGMHGWQWLYLVEGLPPIIMCIVFYALLTDRPHDAKWLTSEQRGWLQRRLDSEEAQREAVRKFSLIGAFSDYKMWLLTLAYFGQNISSYGLVFFLPLIVKGLGVGTNWIGIVSALPYICAFVAMIAWGYHSDITGERKWHLAAAALVAAGGLAACVLTGSGHPVITMVLLCIAMMGQQSLIPIFWSIPSAMLTGIAAAGGLAMINSLGNLGGWFGPSIYGLIKDATGSANLGLLFLAVGPLLTAICALVVGQDRRLEWIPTRR